jgi:hypothetical protein
MPGMKPNLAALSFVVAASGCATPPMPRGVEGGIGISRVFVDAVKRDAARQGVEFNVVDQCGEALKHGQPATLSSRNPYSPQNQGANVVIGAGTAATRSIGGIAGSVGQIGIVGIGQASVQKAQAKEGVCAEAASWNAKAAMWEAAAAERGNFSAPQGSPIPPGSRVPPRSRVVTPEGSPIPPGALDSLIRRANLAGMTKGYQGPTTVDVQTNRTQNMMIYRGAQDGLNSIVSPPAGGLLRWVLP